VLGMVKKKRTQPESLITILSSIPDPRVERGREHKLVDILTIGLCSTLCGQGAFTDMEDFGSVREGWFKEFLELPNGIPSHDTFRRVFSILDTGEFLDAFMRWTRSVRRAFRGEVVAIDGKALRRAKGAGEQARVIVGAWGVEAGISLGQLKVDAKSNEITAVPELLGLLSLEGCIVTIDAMGCQKEIAKKIRGRKAHYVLALKANQGQLYERAKDYLDKMYQLGPGGETYHEESTRGHGRQEVRRCWACDGLDDWMGDVLKTYGQWEGLESIAAVERERTVKGKTTVERHYYITSLAADAKKIGAAARAHWGIENSLHWVLDVNFGEDQSRARTKNASANLSTLRRLAHNMIKTQDPNSKKSVKRRMNIAGWSESHLHKLIGVKLDA
jgi:predicted transposase YbfD/YdcC